MWTCKHCNETFDFYRATDKANHSRHCDKNPKKLDSYKNIKIKVNERIESELGPIRQFEVVCFTCSSEFLVEEREKQFPLKERYFCSRNCANSIGGKAKSKVYHPDETAHYTTVCFRYHKKECIVCGEDKIVAVHHNDCNHYNNDPKNLVPLCPTHHQYVHSKYKDEVQPIIDRYLNEKWS